MVYQRKAGTTDVSVVIRIIDSGDGTPETGVTSATGGIDLEYRREGAAVVNITETDLSALTDAHSDGGLLHISGGYYRLDLPDLAVAAGSTGVLVAGTITGMVVIGCYIQLVAYDPFDTVRLGLTALPNAAADAAGGLPISDAGGLDLDVQRADVAAILVDTGTTIDDLVDDLESRLTAARAGYLDNLNIGGLVASSAEATAIQNNTRVVRVVPQVLERPDSGNTVYRIELLLYDEVGNMEAPDAAPTIGAVDESGNSRDANLDSTTMALVSTGRYRSTYTVSTAHDLEQLIFTFSVVEGGNTRAYGNTTLVVDTTAVDFTAADRVKLDTLHDTRLTAGRAANLDNLNATISSRSTFNPATDIVLFVDEVDHITAFSSDQITDDVLHIDTYRTIADEVLRRGVANVEDTANTTSLAAIILAILESSVSGTTWTIRKTGGTTFVTKTITTDAAAEPITSVT